MLTTRIEKSILEENRKNIAKNHPPERSKPKKIKRRELFPINLNLKQRLI